MIQNLYLCWRAWTTVGVYVEGLEGSWMAMLVDLTEDGFLADILMEAVQHADFHPHYPPDASRHRY